MAHQLFRLREKLCNTPHLMSLQSFEAVLDYVEKRCAGEVELFKDQDSNFVNERYSFNSDIGVAAIYLDGPMTYKPVTMFGMDCGGFSYETFKEDFTFLAESGAKTIAMITSSGGGEAFQLFPTARYIRKVADEYGIKLLNYVDGLSASAAYGLSSIADEIIVAPSSEVGSIGVVVRLINDAKALEKAGYERTFVTGGKDKVPFSADGSFRKEFIEDIQGKVDALYEEFTEFVAEHRNISVEAVRSTEARTFLPKEAIEIGLADGVMSVEDFYTYLADQAQKPQGNKMLKNKLFNMNKTDDEETLEMSQLAELQTQLSAAQEQLVELSSLKDAHSVLQAAFAEKETALASALTEVAQLKDQAASAKAQARKEKLESVGQDETVANALASLDDATFETVFAGYKASFEKQKQVLETSGMLEELGGEGGEPEAVATEDAAKLTTEAAIKQRLGLK